MCEFYSLDDAQRVIEAGKRQYDASKASHWEVESSVGTHTVTVQAWLDNSKINVGLKDPWKFKGDLTELKNWWEGLGDSPVKTYRFMAPEQKAPGKWQVNLHYLTKGAGKRGFNFHLDVPAPKGT